MIRTLASGIAFGYLTLAIAFDLHGTEILTSNIAKFFEIKTETTTTVRPIGGNRIINGESASTGQFAYQAGLNLRKDNSYYWCGGALIGHEWILTAAHCLSGIDEATVYLGSTKKQQGEVIHTVVSNDFILHDQYSSNPLMHDIALIKIPHTPYTTNVSPIDLAEATSDDNVGETGVIAGWGLTSDDTTTSEDLMFTDLQIISNSDCAEVYGSIITDGKFCASTAEGSSTCLGDSGGVMRLKNTNVGVGVSSFVSGISCEKGSPAGFTKISYNRDFIQQHTGL